MKAPMHPRPVAGGSLLQHRQVKSVDFGIPSEIKKIIDKNDWNQSRIVKRYIRRLKTDKRLEEEIKKNYMVGRVYISNKVICIKFDASDRMLLEELSLDCESKSALLRSILVFHCLKGHKLHL